MADEMAGAWGQVRHLAGCREDLDLTDGDVRDLARVIMDLKARVEGQAKMVMTLLDAQQQHLTSLVELEARVEALEANQRGCTCRDPKSPDEAPCDYCTREPEPEGRP